MSLYRTWELNIKESYILGWCKMMLQNGFVWEGALCRAVRNGKAFGTLGSLPASITCFLCNLAKNIYSPGLSFPLFKSGTIKPPFPCSCVVKINSCLQSDLRIYRNPNRI